MYVCMYDVCVYTYMFKHGLCKWQRHNQEQNCGDDCYCHAPGDNENADAVGADDDYGTFVDDHGDGGGGHGDDDGGGADDEEEDCPGVVDAVGRDSGFKHKNHHAGGLPGQF